MATTVKFKISDLNCRVVIRRKVQTPDGMGGFTIAWMTAATCWAHIEVWRGREGYRAQRTEALVTQLVFVRAGTDVQSDDVVTFEGREMPVKYLDYVTDGRKKYIELTCIEGDPAGGVGIIP